MNKFGGLEAIAQSLKTSLRSGLPPSEINDERKSYYGVNFFKPPKIKTIWELVAENFDDKINLILLAAAAVSIVIGLIKDGWPEGLIEGTSIMIALIIIIVVNSGNNWISERQLANLVKLQDLQDVAVHRGSEQDTVTFDASMLLVGDIVSFKDGEKVPADMILIEGQNVMCKESELTGEPDEISKDVITHNNYATGELGTMLAKSLITHGFGKAMVVAVGPHSVAGVITEQTIKEKEPTNLQKKLENMANQIGNVGIGCALLTFLSLVVRVTLEMVDIIPCGCQNIFVC